MNSEELLQSISEESPGGTDLSFSNEFDQIELMRREDDPTLEQGEWVTQLKVADWQGVESLATSLLAKQSKDIRVAGWLIESATHNRGFAGMAEGLNIYTEIIENFWDTLHPQPDEDGWEQRVGSLSWMLSMLQNMAKKTPLVQHGKDKADLAAIHLAQAKHQALSRGTVTLDELLAARVLLPDAIAKIQANTPADFLSKNLDQCRQSIENLTKLKQVTDAKLAHDSPSFATAQKALLDVQDVVKKIARERGVLNEEVVTSTAAIDGNTGADYAGGAIQSRDIALQQLRQVADFFRRTEPHSPVAYLAERAAKWGNLPLHEWLRTVLKDGGALSQIEDLLGIDIPSNTDSQ